mgnify:CR=1 FL=1
MRLLNVTIFYDDDRFTLSPDQKGIETLRIRVNDAESISSH